MNMTRYMLTKKLGCLVILLVTGLLHVAAQKSEPETEFKYLKNSDNSRTLSYAVKISKEDGSSNPAVGIPVVFTCGETKLGTVNTDLKGVAKFIVPASFSLSSETDGKLKFTAVIEENKDVDTKSAAISLRDIDLQMELKEVDSVKKVFIKAFELLPNGEKKPAAKIDLGIYVPRMFSLLKVADGSTGEDGTAEVEFPSGIPGDSIGKITVIARIEENEEYANVEKRSEIAWGIPVNYHIPKFQRALWTAVAPTWMIITLTILLSGVWAHYAYVVYKLWKIKRESLREA